MKQVLKDGRVLSAANKVVAMNEAEKCELSMYDLPPTDEITVEELESFAIERLQGTHFAL